MDQQTAFPYEIIAVDSSTDGTDGLIEREFPQVRLLHFAQRVQVGSARNIGVGAARGEIVLFVDSDMVPNRAWVDEMARGILDMGADAVGGALSNGTPWSVSGSAGFYLEFFRFVVFRGRPGPARFLVGGNSGFRRLILSRMRYSDHSLGEDMLLSRRLAQQGGRLLFLPRASVRHDNRTGFRAVLGYQRKLGAAAFQYRSLVSPAWLKVLQPAPALIFLAPFGVMTWIASTLLWRGCGADLLRFMGILPFCWLANSAWALGFYQEMRRSR